MQGGMERPPGRSNTASLLDDLARLLPADSGQEGLQRVLARVSEAGEWLTARLSAADRRRRRSRRSRHDSSVSSLLPPTRLCCRAT